MSKRKNYMPEDVEKAAKDVKGMKCYRSLLYLHFNTTRNLSNTTRNLSITTQNNEGSTMQKNEGSTTYSNEDSTTHFGFETVPMNEKERKVKEVFEKVSNSYDVMNDVMSGGIHRLWKDYFTTKVDPQPHFRCLDVAGGTGDIAFRLFNRMSKISNVSEKVLICDINNDMLEVGQQRAIELYGNDEVFDWIEGNAEDLPFPHNSFDVYTIAYGLRNVTCIEKALSEAHRVLKPGGKFMCLEFSNVQNPIISTLYSTYSFEVIPVMGQLVANDYESYKYLVESITTFPDQEHFSEMIREAGFEAVRYENLTFGVTAIHTGFKLPQQWNI